MKLVSLLFSLLVLLMPAVLWGAAKPIPNPPALDATSYYLVDFDSGRVLAEKNPDDRVEPASITKLMTAYLVDKAIADGDPQCLPDRKTPSCAPQRLFPGPVGVYDCALHGQ